MRLISKKFSISNFLLAILRECCYHHNNAMDIKESVEYLARERISSVDVRFNNGKWSVHVGVGKISVCVPDSISDDPLISLQRTIERWNTRSIDKPFINWSK